MTCANISLSQSTDAVWDVIVIGGGPAGAVAARQSANAGYSTLLVDKQAFPRAKVCGACVNARALEALALLGMEACISELPAATFDSLSLRCGKHHAKITLPTGKAIARAELDDAIVHEAIRAGVRWLPETTATLCEMIDADASRCVTLMDVSSGLSQNATARIVFVADGLGSPSLRRLAAEFPSVISPASRMGVGGVMANHDGRYADQAIHMTVSQHGYVGIVALPDGSLNMAAAIDSEFLRRQGDVASAVSSLLVESDIASLDLPSVAWKGTPPLTRKLTRPASKRVLVLGDAAGYVEPFTGEGIAWAITSGAAAATLVAQGIFRWTDDLENQWISLSYRLIHQHQFVCRSLAKTLRSHRLATVATRFFSLFPGLASPIVNSSSSLPRHVERFLRTPVRKASQHGRIPHRSLHSLET